MRLFQCFVVVVAAGWHATEALDETPALKSCSWSPGAVQCPSGEENGCLMAREMCDGVNQCPDGSDEASCDNDEEPKVEKGANNADNAVCETKHLKSGERGFAKFYFPPNGKEYTSILLTKETGIGPAGDLSKISKCQDPTKKLIKTQNGNAFGVAPNKKRVFVFNHCSGQFSVCFTRPPLPPEERGECIDRHIRGWHGTLWKKTLKDLKVEEKSRGPIKSINLIKEDALAEMKGRCKKGYSFDNQYSRVWLRHGCQGDFNVCHKNKGAKEDEEAVCETKHLESGDKGLIKFYYAPKGKNYTSMSLTKETGIGPAGDFSKISKCRDPTKKLIKSKNGNAFGVAKNKQHVFVFNHCSGRFQICYTRAPYTPKGRKVCIQKKLRSPQGRFWYKTLRSYGVRKESIGPIVSITLVKEDAQPGLKGRCRKGKDFDNQGNRVWVRQGCQGDFKLCTKPTGWNRGGDRAMASGASGLHSSLLFMFLALATACFT